MAPTRNTRSRKNKARSSTKRAANSVAHTETPSKAFVTPFTTCLSHLMASDSHIRSARGGKSVPKTPVLVETSDEDNAVVDDSDGKPISDWEASDIEVISDGEKKSSKADEGDETSSADGNNNANLKSIFE